MKQNYFVCQGERYNTGDIFYINWYGTYSSIPSIRSAKFIEYDTETKDYTFWINGDRDQSFLSEDLFWKFFRSKAFMAKLNKPKEPRKATFKDECNIDALLIAWVWYIVIMAVSVIFYGRFIIWAVASWIFFDFRKRKLKERGFKV